MSRSALRHLRRVIVAVVGLTVLAIGVAMIVLPGPATVVIPLGLGILAIEFAWAERMLKRLKDEGKRVLGSGSGQRPEPGGTKLRISFTPTQGDAQ